MPQTRPTPGDKIRVLIVDDPANPPSGCYFHPRCPYANDRCQTEAPALREIGPGRKVACHLAETLNLRGVGVS